MLRTLLVLCVFCWIISPLAWAQADPEPSLLQFGAGILATIADQNEFPTGASARLWLLGQYGLEVSVFTRESNPTFSIRALYSFIQTGIVALYAGGGVAFFSEGLSFDSTLQAMLGIEIELLEKLIFVVEVGGVFGGQAAIPATAAAGIFYYF